MGREREGESPPPNLPHQGGGTGAKHFKNGRTARLLRMDHRGENLLPTLTLKGNPDVVSQKAARLLRMSLRGKIIPTAHFFLGKFGGSGLEKVLVSPVTGCSKESE